VQLFSPLQTEQCAIFVGTHSVLLKQYPEEHYVQNSYSSIRYRPRYVMIPDYLMDESHFKHPSEVDLIHYRFKFRQKLF